MRVLVTGAGGMLARYVVIAAERRDPEVVAQTRSELDVRDPAAVNAKVAAELPDVIINCAAWTDVDGAESAEAAALELNGVAPGLLARAASEHRARLIHISTDYVFAGDARRPYVESDETGPKTAYGRTKLAGEQAVIDVGDGHAVVRTAWLFGAGGSNFVATMLGLARDGHGEVAVVTDQIGCPTFAGQLAEALLDVAERRVAGVAHIAGGGQCSWNEFAREIFRQARLRCSVRDVSSSEFVRPAPRPAWSVLVSERAEVPRLAAWQSGLSEYLVEVHEELAR